jgi:hypothetical protein
MTTTAYFDVYPSIQTKSLPDSRFHVCTLLFSVQAEPNHTPKVTAKVSLLDLTIPNVISTIEHNRNIYTDLVPGQHFKKRMSIQCD